MPNSAGKVVHVPAFGSTISETRNLLECRRFRVASGIRAIRLGCWVSVLIILIIKQVILKALVTWYRKLAACPVDLPSP